MAARKGAARLVKGRSKGEKRSVAPQRVRAATVAHHRRKVALPPAMYNAPPLRVALQFSNAVSSARSVPLRTWTAPPCSARLSRKRQCCRWSSPPSILTGLRSVTWRSVSLGAPASITSNGSQELESASWRRRREPTCRVTPAWPISLTSLGRVRGPRESGPSSSVYVPGARWTTRGLDGVASELSAARASIRSSSLATKIGVAGGGGEGGGGEGGGGDGGDGGGGDGGGGDGGGDGGGEGAWAVAPAVAKSAKTKSVRPSIVLLDSRFPIKRIWRSSPTGLQPRRTCADLSRVPSANEFSPPFH